MSIALPKQAKLSIKTERGWEQLLPGKGWSRGREFVPRTICKICGARFYAPPIQRKRGGGVFCSNKCKAVHLAELRKKPPVVKACAHCGSSMSLQPCREDQKFCSRDCATNAKMLPSRVALYEKQGKENSGTCERCGQPKRRAQRFCSIKCAVKSRKVKAAKPLPIANCQGCGKAFNVQRGTKGIVCSLRCWGKVITLRQLGISYTHANGGKRADLCGQYFRSGWEANWARYLNLLKADGLIVDWQYEPETFDIVEPDGRLGSYTPDFGVTGVYGGTVYHEVKGYMDDRSKRKLSGMQASHPGIQIVVIDSDRYSTISKVARQLIPNWEIAETKSW